MSDTLGISIKVDAGNVKPTVDAVEQSFAKLEARGPSVSEALSKGMRDGSAAADRLRSATGAVVNPFDSLTAAIKRESDMLQRIHGPAKQYGDDLQTLDALLEKNAISTEEYAQQVTKLNRALQERNEHEQDKPNAGEKLEGGIGFVGAAMAGGVGGEAVEMVKHFAESVLEDGQRIKDTYTQMANASLRFTDSVHDADDVIEEQSKLGEELHSTFGPTVDLYARVKEGADDLNLSHREQIELTKTLGEEVQLAGKPLSEASGLMSRFAFAMQTGHIETRQLAQIMREVPGIEKIWEQAFGKSAGALQAAVKAGKISVEDLVRALINNGAVADKQFEKHKATNEVLKEQFKENVALKGSYEAILSTNTDYVKHQEEVNKAHKSFIDVLRESDDAEDEFEKHIKQQGREALGLLATSANDADKAVSKLVTSMGDVARTLGAIGDNWDQPIGRVGRAFKVANEEATKLGNAKQQLQGLDDAVGSGAHIVDVYEKRKALIEEIGGEEVKYLDSIRAPMEDYIRHRRMLNDVIKAGLVTSQQALDASLKLDASIGKHADVNDTDRFVNRHGGQSTYLDIAEPGSTSAPVESEALKTLMGLYEETRTAAEKYADQVAEVTRLSKEAGFSDEARANLLEHLKEKYESSLPSFFDDAKNDPLKQYEERAKKTAAALQTAFEPVGKLLIDAAKTGEVSWAEFGSSVEDMILKLITDELKLKAAAALAGLINGPAPSSGLGAAAAGIGGGGGMGSLGSLVSLFGGAADGADFTIPHFANGGTLTPMRSGRDDHLLQMFVRSGERVQVQTEEQQRAAAQGGGQGGGAQVHNHNLTIQGIDDRAIHAAMDTPGGTAAVFKIVRDNAGAFRALLQKG